jgi:hypothetical protein
MPGARDLFPRGCRDVRDRAVGGDDVTTWICPGCRMTIEARAVAAGHRCPNRQTRWTDFTPGESTTNRVAESRSWGDSESVGDSRPNRGAMT